MDAARTLAEALPRELVAELLALARASGAEFAEIYAETTTSQAFSYEERRLKTSSHAIIRGLGVRAVVGDQTGYAYADGLAPEDLREAARVASRIAREGRGGPNAAFRVVETAAPFTLVAPLPATLDERAKIALIRRADDAARRHDPRVQEVSIGFADLSRSFVVANSDGVWATDTQHLARLTVQALALAKDQRQQGLATDGGAVEAGYFEDVRTPESIGAEAARIATTLLEAEEPEAGSYPVVIGPGWGGVLVHECFGHSMEGDTIRKRTSIRAGLEGRRVATPGVTIVDSARVPHSRGSFRVDDEGTPAQRTVLVEDGVLVGYLWDRLNARLTGHTPTGNGRRSSYRQPPLCRMTNTYIEPGEHTPEELIASVSHGLYCKGLGGGSVSPADGNFSFQVTEAYRIEHGRIGAPVRGATLTGNGADAMLKIDGIGNDLAIDGATGTCGKDGQWKPVGVGQPTVRFTEITVGGTRA